MINKTIKLIHRLRVYFLLFFSLAFLFFIGLSPIDVGKFVGAEWGRAVGLNVGVAENPFNRLALELKQKEDSLDAREQDLIKREQNLLAPNRRQDALIAALGIGVFVLLVLVIANYYLDYKRRQGLPGKE